MIRLLPRARCLVGSAADIGRRGERLAAGHMKRGGFRILGRNLQTHAGEADLLCEDPKTGLIVLVEVKSRRRESGRRDRHEPETQINRFKRGRLLGIARALRRANGWETRPIRIDVIAVDFIPGRRGAEIRHHVNAVTE